MCLVPISPFVLHILCSLLACDTNPNPLHWTNVITNRYRYRSRVRMSDHWLCTQSLPQATDILIRYPRVCPLRSYGTLLYNDRILNVIRLLIHILERLYVQCCISDNYCGLAYKYSFCIRVDFMWHFFIIIFIGRTFMRWDYFRFFVVSWFYVTLFFLCSHCIRLIVLYMLTYYVCVIWSADRPKYAGMHLIPLNCDHFNTIYSDVRHACAIY